VRLNLAYLMAIVKEGACAHRQLYGLGSGGERLCSGLREDTLCVEGNRSASKGNGTWETGDWGDGDAENLKIIARDGQRG